MTLHSNLKVDVLGNTILVAIRGTCLRAKYRRQEAPWLATEEFGPDDPEAGVTQSEFRNLAWTVANDTARNLGWISEDLHISAHHESQHGQPILSRQADTMRFSRIR